MIINLYVIKDELNDYTPPMMLPNDESAIRYFHEMKINNNTIMTCPKDFSIWKVGTFDSETAKMTNDLKLLERG